MTKQLLTRMNKELKGLEYELKNKLPEEIAKAAALGDLSENAEYEAALDRQRLLQSKYRKLQDRINEIARIDLSRLPKDRVGYGTIVELFDLDTETEVTYQLVMPEDSDVKTQRISISSPIGKALMGKKVDDEVSIVIPSGKKHYEVVNITSYHSTDQDL